MLGKQGWRLISNPESLVARVYKARYFADSDFLHSSLGNNPSFVWRSIFEAKKVVAEGCRWRLGTEGTEDVIFWRFEESGNYSVRSVYRFLQSQRGAWRLENDDNIWRVL